MISSAICWEKNRVILKAFEHYKMYEKYEIFTWSRPFAFVLFAESLRSSLGTSFKSIETVSTIQIAVFFLQLMQYSNITQVEIERKLNLKCWTILNEKFQPPFLEISRSIHHFLLDQNFWNWKKYLFIQCSMKELFKLWQREFVAKFSLFGN